MQFFVNNRLLAEDADGPPYAVEWIDEHPLELTEITVVARDGAGNVARDSVILEPFEVFESVQVARVLLEVSVRDQASHPIEGLGPADFRLEENRTSESIELARTETVPATFTLLVDGSASMSPWIGLVREVAHRFGRALGPGDRLMVVPFRRTLGPVTGPTLDGDTAAGAVGAMATGGGTALLDCLVQTAKLLAGVDGRRALVVVTDGRDSQSRASVAEAIAALQASGITAYVVATSGLWTPLQQERLLRHVAESTGGLVFFPRHEGQLPELADVVVRDVRQRYLVTYTPTNRVADGTWREITLTVSRPRVHVNTRPGYFAPRPVPLRASIEFRVTDREGRTVDLNKDDIIVNEDGIRQTVTAFNEAVDPVAIVMALDQSGSMASASEAVRLAALSFVGAMRPQDQLAVVHFADDVFFAHDLSTNREHTREAIDQHHAHGGTALYDALYDALMRLKRVHGRRAVVLLTDGRDENAAGTAPGSARNLNDVLHALDSVDASVFSIGLGASVNRTLLERLATSSGGEAYFAEHVSALRATFSRVLDSLSRRYVLAYMSTNPVRDGTWRRVDIRTRQEGTTVSSRGGYRAPVQ